MADSVRATRAWCVAGQDMDGGRVECEMYSGEVWKVIFFFQAEDGIRYAQESRGLGDVYKRQGSFPDARPLP